MPGSGTPLLWNENAPAETDIADAAPIRSIVTALRNGLAVEHSWPNASGANFGYHLLGSARAFYDVESNVSSSGTDGRILVTSDTSRLFHVGSAGTLLLGGHRMLSAGSSPVGGQNYYWAVEFGANAATGGGITYPNSGFSGAPFVTASVWSDTGNTSNPCFVMNYTTVNAKTVATLLVYPFNSNIQVINSATTILWMSIGTRVL